MNDIKIDKEKITIDSFMDYGGTRDYFALGNNGNLYYLKNYNDPKQGYILLKEKDKK